MNGMFAAELAVFFDFNTFRVVLFVFERVVISLLTFITSQSYLVSSAFRCHNAPSEHEKINTPKYEMLMYCTKYKPYCQVFYAFF